MNEAYKDAAERMTSLVMSVSGGLLAIIYGAGSAFLSLMFISGKYAWDPWLSPQCIVFSYRAF